MVAELGDGLSFACWFGSSPEFSAKATRPPITSRATTRAAASRPPRLRGSLVVRRRPCRRRDVPAAGRRQRRAAAGSASVRPARSRATVAAAGAAAPARVVGGGTGQQLAGLTEPGRSCGSFRSRPTIAERQRTAHRRRRDRVGDDRRSSVPSALSDVERRATLGRDVQGGAERPEVALGAGLLAAGTLRGHVGGGAEDHAGRGERRVARPWWRCRSRSGPPGRRR